MKRKLAKKKDIVNYWIDFLLQSKEYPMFFWLSKSDKENLLDTCFACGKTGYVERCHIVAHCEGGSGNPENLHLLCPNCHKESEMYNDEVYFNWFQIKNTHDYYDIWMKEKTPIVKRFLKSIYLDYDSEYLNSLSIDESKRLAQGYLDKFYTNKL